jgi:uncharacterized protein (TIGR00369 family)
MADAGQSKDRDAAPADGAGLARGWLENSPFVAHLGIRLDEMEPDRARLSMPFSDSLPTMGEVVHGGAISSLIDTAAAAVPALKPLARGCKRTRKSASTYVRTK